MTIAQFVGLWLLIIAAIAALSGCATDPVSGRQTWDVAATARLLGAVSGALAPQPTPAPALP